MADESTSIRDATGAVVPVLSDTITTRNGEAVAEDDQGRAQLVKLLVGADGAGVDVTAANPLPVREPGTFAYAAGAAPANINVPTGARIKRVSLAAGLGGPATVSILGGATITVPAGAAFDEVLPGDALGTSATNDVAIAGVVAAYYVAWVT